jgi:hypothetical protein
MNNAEKNKIIKLIDKGTVQLENLSNDLKCEKDIVNKSIEKDWKSFEYAANELKMDLEYIYEALKIDGRIFFYLSDNLKMNRDLCLAAISYSGENFEFIKCKDKNEREFIKEAVSLNGNVIRYMHESIKDDFEIAKIAVEQDEFAFGFLSDKLRNNEELLLYTCQKAKSGYALKYASNELKSNKNVVSEILKFLEASEISDVIKYSNDDIRSNRDIIKFAVKRSGGCLNYASIELKNDKEIVFEAVNEEPSAIAYASSEILDDTKFLNKIIEIPETDFKSHYWHVLENASERLKNDRDFVLSIIKKNGLAFKLVNDIFKADEEMIIESILSVKSIPRIIDDIIVGENDFLIHLKNLYKIGATYATLKTDLLTNKKRVLAIIKVRNNYYDVWDSIPKNYMKDLEICLAAIKSDKRAYNYISDDLKNNPLIMEVYNN